MRRRRGVSSEVPIAVNARGQVVDASEYVSHAANVVKARRDGVRVPSAPWLVMGGKKK